MGKIFRSIALLSGALLLFGVCACSRVSLSGSPKWRAKRIVTIGDLNAPACALPCEEKGLLISNIETPDKSLWADDGKGYIGLYSLDGMVRRPRWLDSAPPSPIHAPKGMAILNGFLYFSDNTRLMRCSLDRKGAVEEVALPAKGVKLCDVATDGLAVYVSEMGGEAVPSTVYRCEPGGASRAIKAPAGVKGITFLDSKMYAVSWDLHEIYELDANGAEEPKPLGVAEHFQNLDGIEGLSDGTLLVTDHTAGRVCAVSPDRATVYTVAELNGPADLGVYRSPDLLYVPQLELNQVMVFRLVLE